MPDLHNPEHIKQILNNYLQSKNPDLSDFDKQDFNELLQDTMGGVDSAKYLSGHKKNEVETFYDKHPVQATVHDSLNKAPWLAGGVVAGQVGHSMLKDFLLNRKINSSISGSDKKPGMSEYTAENYEKSPDLKRVFPRSTTTEYKTNKDTGTTSESLKFNHHNDPGVYGSTYQKLNVGKSELQKPNSSGYIGKMLGLDEQKNQRLVRLMSQRFPKDSINPNSSHLDSARHFANIGQELGGVNDTRARHIGAATAQRIKDPHMGLKNLASHVNPRLAGGAAAVGLGGMALAPLVSYLQKKTYGQDQVKQWMTNRRQSEGNFDE